MNDLNCCCQQYQQYIHMCMCLCPPSPHTHDLVFLIFFGPCKKIMRNNLKLSHWFLYTYWCDFRCSLNHLTEESGININLHKHVDRKERLTYSKCIHQYAAPFITSCCKLEHSPSILKIRDPSNRTSPEPHGIFCEGARLVSEQILHLVYGNIRSQQRLYHSKYDKQLF